MSRQNKELERDLRKKFGKLYQLRHDEEITNKDYWKVAREFDQEVLEANPNQLSLIETPWMNTGYYQGRERIEKLNEAIALVKLTKRMKLVLDLYLAGYSQSTIAGIVGTQQPNIARQIKNIGKKLKKIMEERI